MIVKNKTSLIFSTTTTTSLSSSSLLLLANLLLGSCLCLQQDEQVKYADGRLTKLTKQQQLAADILYKNSDYLSKTLPLNEEDNDNWRFKYIDELHPNGFEYLIRDKSFEQRVADMIDLTNTNRPTDVNIFAIDSGDTQLDEQQLLLAADNENNDQLCSQHLDEILLQINEMSKLTKNQQKPSEKHVRLARVLDSFAHYEGGLFAGRDFFIGSYYQCISSNLLLNSIPTDSDDAKPVVVVDKPASLIKTRYCMAKLDLEDHLSPSLKTRHREEHEHKPKIYAGICLPSTCHTRNFMMMQHGRLNTNKARVQTIVDSQFKLPEFMFREQNLSLHSVFCLIDSDSKLNELSLAAKIFIVLIITWLLLIGVATYKLNVNPAWCENEDFFVHHFKCKQWFNVALKSLSLNESWNDFMENNRTITCNDAGNDQNRLHTNSTSSSTINLNTINPIKALACAVVIFGHSLVMTIMSSTDLIATNKQVEQDPWMFLFLMSTLVVDTIFVITGILLSYLTLIRLDKMKKSSKIYKFSYCVRKNHIFHQTLASNCISKISKIVAYVLFSVLVQEKYIFSLGFRSSLGSRVKQANTNGCMSARKLAESPNFSSRLYSDCKTMLASRLVCGRRLVFEYFPGTNHYFILEKTPFSTDFVVNSHFSKQRNHATTVAHHGQNPARRIQRGALNCNHTTLSCTWFALHGTSS